MEIGPLGKLSSFPVAGGKDFSHLRETLESWEQVGDPGPNLGTPQGCKPCAGGRLERDLPGFDCLVSVLFPEPAAPVCAAARVALGPRELWGSEEPLSFWCALLHLFVGLLKLNPIQLCVFEHLCLEHSWSRFFPGCCPLCLRFIYPIYYSFISTELEFFVLLTGMRICFTGYKAMLVPVCLGLKNIPEPLRVTCNEGFSPQPSTSLLETLDRALSRRLCSQP